MLSLFKDDGNLVALEWGKTADKQPSPLLEEARRQLNAYFDGTLQDFGLPLAPEGASFQRAVWDRLRRISFVVARPTQTSPRPLTMPPGPSAAPVGGNPIPIIIPCHRVIAKGGRRGGFSGFAGLEMKRRLLRLEGISVT